MKTLEVLKKLDAETKAEVYLVGGYVRDLIRNKRNYDLDIVVKNYHFKEMLIFLKKHGKIKLVNLAKTSDKFGVSLVLFRASDKIEAQISMPRRGSKQIADPNNTLRQDVKHRDFTLNGIYLPVNYKSKNDVIDHVGGRQSIYQRTIFAIGNPEDRIKESPIRVLRAISLAARTNYTIDNSVIQQMFNYSHLLLKVPIEGIRGEFNKILLSKKPSKYFRLMSKLGVLKMFMPELDRCRGLKQDKRYHKWDVFNHCLYTCDNIEPNLILRLAAILHDVGKFTAKAMDGDRITFHKHEMEGVKLARDLLSRFRYSGKLRKEILFLVRLHMYHYTREFSDAAVRRFIDRAGITVENVYRLDDLPLFKLRAAERLGNGLKTIPVTEKQKDFQMRIIDVFKESKGFTVGDLEINGKDIMSTFNLKQSPKIGDILKYLLTKILENPDLNNRRDLLSITTKYLVDKGLI